jgi:tetratricopeptide (TPR) repeat protein
MPSDGLLTLCMILKDEAHTIARTLASAKPFIDRWVILDTGSTDGTQAVVRRELEGVPGELHEEPFVDFATTRNRSLDLCGDATEFILWLDADDELRNGAALRKFLQSERGSRAADREAYNVRIDMGFVFDSSRVLRARAGWRFKGVVHEVLVHPDRPPPGHRVPDASIRHEGTAQGVERTRKRWERDVVLLAGALDKSPGDTRTAFYLACTLCWLRRDEEAIAAFRRRIAMGGWYEEIFQSKLEIARAAERLDRPWPEVLGYFLEAYAQSPHRAEPLHDIALHHNKLGEHALCVLYARRAYDLPHPKGDTLFVEADVYAWKAADLLGTSAYWIGELELGEEAARKALRARPDDERLKKNLGFYLDRKTAMKKKSRQA